MNKLTATEIKQQMYDLGYMYYPAERLFRKLYSFDSNNTAYKLDNPIVKTWKQARELLEN